MSLLLLGAFLNHLIVSSCEGTKRNTRSILFAVGTTKHTHTSHKVDNCS